MTVTLGKLLLHPATVISLIVAFVVIGRMVIQPRASMVHFLFLFEHFCALRLEISLLSKLLIFIVLSNCNLSVVFLLFDPLFGVDGWELDVFLLGVEGEHWNEPVAFFIVPLGPLMQFIKLILI